MVELRLLRNSCDENALKSAAPSYEKLLKDWTVTFRHGR